MSGRTKLVRAVAAATVALGVLAPAAQARTSSAAPVCFASGLVPGQQRTIGIDAKASPKAVKRGGVVKISIFTFRPPNENALDVEGLNPPKEVPRQPAGNVNITLGVESGGGYVSQNIGTMTGEDGKKTIKMKLERYHYKGAAELVIRAEVNHYQSDQCVEFQEYGYQRFPNAFVIR